MLHLTRHPQAVAALLIPLAVAACSDGAFLPTEVGEPLFHHADGPHQVELCKQGPAGSSATFSVSATSGTLVAGASVTLDAEPVFDPSACTVIWQSTGPEDVVVTVTEVEMTPGTSIEAMYVLDAPGSVNLETGTATANVNGSTGALIVFKNAGTPEEEEGFEGCTPGFWRQAHHHQYWTGFSPAAAWTTAFDDPGSHRAPGRNGATFNGSTPLGTAVAFGGGGIFALARHAVAALLNASSADVDYPMSVAGVQALVNDALESGDYEEAKNIFEAYNELGCDVK